MKTLRLTGNIDKNGKLGLSGTTDLKTFQESNKGESVIFELTILEKGDVKKMQGYFYAYVIKELQEGFYNAGYYYNLKKVERHMMLMFPLTNDEETVYDFKKDKLHAFISFCQHYAAQNLGKYISDPITLNNK